MTARLHHERIARSDAPPARWLMFTHGIYGAGSNWRAIARKLVERRRDWGVVLVDLRQHGRSQPGDPPHTVEACAADVNALIGELGEAGEVGEVGAIAGHSFGGKVMLAARAAASVEQTWLFDASPAPRPGALTEDGNTVVTVLELLERLPAAWPRREDFIAAITAEGHDVGLAQWLAMNVVADPADPTGTLTLRLDTVALRALLVDYYATDLWPALWDPAGGRVELVIADRAAVYRADDLSRLATAPPHVHVHHVDAGHWLHIEAAAAVVDLLASELP